MLELKEIRALLENLNAKPKNAGNAFPPSASQAEIPQPSRVIDYPEDVQVHFGKNSGIALGKLSARSVEWYATEQPPRLDSSGKPYPERPQEAELKNAARMLYHRTKGTLASSGVKPAQKQAEQPTAQTPDEQVPF